MLVERGTLIRQERDADLPGGGVGSAVVLRLASSLRRGVPEVLLLAPSQPEATKQMVNGLQKEVTVGNGR